MFFAKQEKNKESVSDDSFFLQRKSVLKFKTKILNIRKCYALYPYRLSIPFNLFVIK